MINLRIATLALTGLIATGCASVPKQELGDYRDAFDKARNASQEVLLEYSNASDLTRRSAANNSPQKNATTASPYPNQIIQTDTPTASDETVGVRINALDAVSKYNAILSDLAEGKSVDQVSSSAKSLIDTLGSVVSMAPGIGPLIAGFAVEIEKARSREEVKKAIDSGEPIVVKILTILDDERDNYYQVYKSLHDYDLPVIAMRINDRINTMKKMTQEKSPPDDRNTLISIARDMENKIQPATKFIPEIKTPIEFVSFKGTPDNSTKFTATFEQELRQLVEATDNDVTQYLHKVDQVNAYYTMLEDYGQLLDKSRTALESLRIAIDKPQSASAQISAVVSTTLKLRADIIKFRHQTN